MRDKDRARVGDPAAGKKARILVVEDESIIADDLAAMLRRQGYQVSGTAATGEESIVRVGEQRPDLVFMDIRLKGAMSGVEAAREIRARWGIPVVYLTAYDEPDCTVSPGQENGTPRLVKPFDDGDIARLLARCLPGHNN